MWRCGLDGAHGTPGERWRVRGTAAAEMAGVGLARSAHHNTRSPPPPSLVNGWKKATAPYGTRERERARVQRLRQRPARALRTRRRSTKRTSRRSAARAATTKISHGRACGESRRRAAGGIVAVVCYLESERMIEQLLRAGLAVIIRAAASSEGRVYLSARDP